MASHHHDRLKDSQIFDTIDTDNSKGISIDELRVFMRGEDPSCTEKTVQDIFQKMDKDQDDSVSRKEFVTRYRRLEGSLKGTLPLASPLARSSPLASPLQRETTSPLQKTLPKKINGDICPFAIPLLRMDLDKGDAFEAVRTIAEVCSLLTQFRQLAEIWLYQVQARECVRLYLAEERAAAVSDMEDNNLLIAAIARLERCDRLYQLCYDLGIFTDVAYEQHMQPTTLGVPWDPDELLLRKFSTASAKTAGTALWKKYMRRGDLEYVFRRIQQFKNQKDIEAEKVVDARFCIPLQAFLRRFVTKEQNCCLAAAVRRRLAQDAYKDLPLQYRLAMSRIQASLRRKFLLRRLTILREACMEHGIEFTHDWTQLPAAKQLALYKSLQYGLDPKEPELDAFQAFVQQGHPSLTSNNTNTVSGPPKQQTDLPQTDFDFSFLEEEQPAVTNFRSQDQAPNLTGEQIVGRDVRPEEGMRVIFSKAALEEFPELLEDSGGGIGTITWVDPEDADGDGVTGDICAVKWDKTGLTGDYRTGFEGHFRLAMVASKRVRKADDDGSERLVGLDVEPKEGMRVVLCKAALEEFPELLSDCGGTPEEPGIGIITWVDPEDADGDGVIGDICEVQWQKTGVKGDYRTGFEGDFRLALSMGNRKRREGQDADEDLVGIDAHPQLGMRVVLCKEAVRDFPDLLLDSGMNSIGMLGAGIITWIDEEDYDGDGHTGDVCEVEWERTGIKSKYDTGLNGNFRLAETVPLLHEIAGMRLQKVFRGHRSRRVLRHALITKYLQEREMEDAYIRFLSALQLQCALRCRQARLRLIFQRRLSGVNAKETSVGPDPHIKVPLKLQAVYRGHIWRGKLRSAILSIFMIKNSVKELWEDERKTRAFIKKAYFILHTHPRIRSWRNHAVRMLAHVSYHSIMKKKYTIGVVWHAFCYWMQHSLDAKDRVDYLSLLIHRTWKNLEYLPYMKDALYRWGFRTRSQLWLEETRSLVAAVHDRCLTRLKFKKTSDFALFSRVQRESAFRLRSRITFVMCVGTLREWHICVWRRNVMRIVGDVMLPFWLEFLIWRCFCSLKFNGMKGQMILSRAEISKHTLQQKFASVSKLSQSALIRNTKKRTGVKGPTIPLPQFTNLETAERIATAMHDNDLLYRPLLTSKTFPYPTASSLGGTSAGSRSEVSTPPYGSAGSAMGQPKKKQKKKFKTNEQIEQGFWDARSKALIADPTSWDVPDIMRKPATTINYTTVLPDLTRRPVRQTGAEILAEKFGIEPKVLVSLHRPRSEDTESFLNSPAARPVPRMAWETQTFDRKHLDRKHPDTSQAQDEKSRDPIHKKRMQDMLHPRSSTALGRLQGSYLPPL